MKKNRCIWGVLAIIATMSVCLGRAETADTRDAVRFDGVYQAHPGGGSQSLYIRFYPDNYVVVMSFARSPSEVAHLINREFAELPQGRYTVENGNVAFTTKAARGEIDYSGKVGVGSLAMHIHSRITGFSADERFDFVPVEFQIDRKAFERLSHP